MSYNISYSTLPTLTINSIGYSSTGNSISILNNTWAHGNVTLPVGVWLCTMSAYSNGALGTDQGNQISIGLLPDTFNTDYRSYGVGNMSMGVGVCCSLTAVFTLTASTVIYFNVLSGPSPSGQGCSYSYTRLA